MLNSSVMLGNYLQQTTSTDDIFRCIFFLGALRVKTISFLKDNHTFVEIDYEIVSTVIRIPSADTFKKGWRQLPAEECD